MVIGKRVGRAILINGGGNAIFVSSVATSTGQICSQLQIFDFWPSSQNVLHDDIAIAW